MPTTPQTIVNEAKRLQRLQSQRAKLRGQLRSIDAEIKLSKKNLKALVNIPAKDENDTQLPPGWAKHTK